MRILLPSLLILSLGATMPAGTALAQQPSITVRETEPLPDSQPTILHSPTFPAGEPSPTAPSDVASEETTPEAPPAPEAPKSNAIRLRGLNKVTARISTLEAPLGTVMRFGNLEIVAHRCWQSPPEERPESAGLLEIWEQKPSEEPQRIFSGWMFASSPGLSALENPVYDVTVLSCSTVEMEE